MATRKATHAGSWYSSVPERLSEQLEHYLNDAQTTHAPARAIIAPHAGYQYSGPCAAHAYKQINPAPIKRIFILGPAHHQPYQTCALTTATKYATPFYDLHVDDEVNKALKATGEFELMSLGDDEDEHSLEMHLPYIAKMMEGRSDSFTIVPIVVGSLESAEQERRFGRILADYLVDPKNLFVVSSDFCHWGRKFRYTYHDVDPEKPIYQFIEELDRLGMDQIEKLDPEGFRAYIEDYGNTICGRYPILLLLLAVEELVGSNRVQSASLKFVKYAQSQQCTSLDHNSVSYAAASLIIQ